jgi:hypothetical protein
MASGPDRLGDDDLAARTNGCRHEV